MFPLRRAGKEGKATKRRNFGKVVALTAIGIPPTSKRAEADETTAPTLTAITGAQRRLEATTPARELAPAAVAHLDMTKRALKRVVHSAFGRDICAALSETAGFTAWLHADMHDTGTARTYYRMAVNTAKRAEHRFLIGYMIGSLAAFEIDNDDPVLGVSLLAQARSHLGDQPPPIAQVWLSSIEALGHAATHNRSAALRAIGDAERAVSAAEHTTTPPWPWVFPFDHAKLAGYRALTMARLGCADDAVSAFTDSLSSAQPGMKQRAVIMAEIALARCQAGEYDEAFHLADQALTIGLAYDSERIIQRVRRFRRSYAGPPTPTVSTFDDKLRTTLG